MSHLEGDSGALGDFGILFQGQPAKLLSHLPLDIKFSVCHGCNTLAAGVPLLTENAGEMSDGMDLDAMIAVAQLRLIITQTRTHTQSGA